MQNSSYRWIHSMYTCIVHYRHIDDDENNRPPVAIWTCCIQLFRLQDSTTHILKWTTAAISLCDLLSCIWSCYCHRYRRTRNCIWCMNRSRQLFTREEIQCTSLETWSRKKQKESQEETTYIFRREAGGSNSLPSSLSCVVFCTGDETFVKRGGTWRKHEIKSGREDELDQWKESWRTDSTCIPTHPSSSRSSLYSRVNRLFVSLNLMFLHACIRSPSLCTFDDVMPGDPVSLKSTAGKREKKWKTRGTCSLGAGKKSSSLQR